MEGKPKISGTNPKPEEIINFYPIFLCILQTLYSTSDYVEQNSHVLVTVIYNLSTHIIEGKLKILETNHKYEEILHFYLIFCVFNGLLL